MKQTFSLKHVLVKHGAPTLAGIKTGNMFTVPNNATDIVREIRELNGILTKKGLRLVPIRRTENSTLIYLYRPDRLSRDLKMPKAVEIMSKKGYPCGNTACCICTLVKHLMQDESFPHEIGLFLGYPPSDVEEFMKDTSNGVRCSGCWKAYSNEAYAKKTFESYKHCTAIYCKEAENGRPLEAMIVDKRSA